MLVQSSLKVIYTTPADKLTSCLCHASVGTMWYANVVPMPCR